MFDFPFDSNSKQRMMDKLCSIVEFDPSQTIRLKALKFLCRFVSHNNFYSVKFFQLLMGRCLDKDKRIRLFCFTEVKKHVPLFLSKQDETLEKTLLRVMDIAIRHSNDMSVQRSAKQLLIELLQQDGKMDHWIRLLFDQFENEFSVWEEVYAPFLCESLHMASWDTSLSAASLHTTNSFDDIDI